MTNLHKIIIISIYRNIVQDKYTKILNYIKEVSNNYNLCFNEVAVMSNFDGITTKYGLDIELTDITMSINSELYDFMRNIIKSDKHNKELKIGLGYGLRTIDLYHMRASITSGSHCPANNLILFDIPSYKILGLEAMKYRFAHEILHEFGFDEQQTLNMEYEYYNIIKDHISSLIYSLYIQISNAEKHLFSRINEMIMSNYESMNLINSTYNYLLNEHIPDFENSTLSIIHPITKEKVDISFLLFYYPFIKYINIPIYFIKSHCYLIFLTVIFMAVFFICIITRNYKN